MTGLLNIRRHWFLDKSIRIEIIRGQRLLGFALKQVKGQLLVVPCWNRRKSSLEGCTRAVDALPKRHIDGLIARHAVLVGTIIFNLLLSFLHWSLFNF